VSSEATKATQQMDIFQRELKSFSGKRYHEKWVGYCQLNAKADFLQSHHSTYASHLAYFF